MTASGAATLILWDGGKSRIFFRVLAFLMQHARYNITVIYSNRFRFLFSLESRNHRRCHRSELDFSTLLGSPRNDLNVFCINYSGLISFFVCLYLMFVDIAM